MIIQPNTLKGQRVRVLPLRTEDGLRIHDYEGLTGKEGVVVRATDKYAVVDITGMDSKRLDLDRITVVKTAGVWR